MKHNLRKQNFLISAYSHGRRIYIIRSCYNELLLVQKFLCCSQHLAEVTAQKMKFSIKNFFSNCDQTRGDLRIWSQLLKKSLMENFIFCAVSQEKPLFTIKDFFISSFFLSSAYQDSTEKAFLNIYTNFSGNICDEELNCVYGIAERQKALSLISSREHCQRSSPFQISNML